MSEQQMHEMCGFCNSQHLKTAHGAAIQPEEDQRWNRCKLIIVSLFNAPWNALMQRGRGLRQHHAVAVQDSDGVSGVVLLLRRPDLNTHDYSLEKPNCCS